jgi:hypothetical protein
MPGRILRERRLPMSNRFGAALAAAALIFSIAGALAADRSPDEADLCIRIELQRLEALYGLLDACAAEIWPGWDNYMDVEVRMVFPDRVRMIVNPHAEPAAGYEILEGATVRGRKVYLDRADEIPMALKPPLGRGGAAQFGWIFINLEPLENVPAPEACRRENYADWEHAQSESQILTYAHELFHEYQTTVWPSRKKVAAAVSKMREKKAQAPAPQGAPERQDRADLLPIYYVPLSYPIYKEIEGRALLAAYGARDDREAVEYLKDAMAARRIRHENMPEEEVVREINGTVGEGTAQYAQVKLAQLARDSGRRDEGAVRGDPYFFGFRFMDEYIRHWTVRQMEASCLDTFDARPFHYSFGMLAGFLCDRLVPGWKKDFLEAGRTFDDILEGFLGLDDREWQDVGNRLKNKYPYDEIAARHGRLIKERDDAIALVEGRKGKRFVVDWTATKVVFPEIVPRGAVQQHSYRKIFPCGIEKMTFGEVELIGRDTPMDRFWIYLLEWVDTDVAAGEKGYTLTYENKDGDVYQGAVLTTAGFVLKAPELRLDETADEVWIEVLSQVRRDAKK